MPNLFKISNIPTYEIKKLDNFFKKQNEEIKLDIFSEKRNEYFKLKNQFPSIETSMLEMASFYSSIFNFYKLNQNTSSKNKSMSTAELKKFNDFSIKSVTKQKYIARKENFLLDKSSIVNDLIAKKRSYREMSDYFKRFHKMKVSHTYLKKTIDKYPNIFNKKRI